MNVPASSAELAGNLCPDWVSVLLPTTTGAARARGISERRGRAQRWSAGGRVTVRNAFSRGDLACATTRAQARAGFWGGRLVYA